MGNYSAGLFSIDDVANKNKVHCILLNNRDVHNNRSSDRVYVITPLTFLYSYKTSLNYAYAVDISSEFIGEEFLEVVRIYKEYTNNLFAAQQFLRDTGDIEGAIETLLPEWHNKCEFSWNENDGCNVIIKSRNRIDIWMYIILYKNGKWVEIKTPLESLSSFEWDKDVQNSVNSMYYDIEKTIDYQREEYIKFMRGMELGVKLPDEKIEGAAVRNNGDSMDILLEDSYRIRVKYSINSDGKTFKREPKAYIVCDDIKVSVRGE